MNLAERLKTLRTENNYTQRQLATRLHLSPSIISAYETGERQPSLDILIKLADIYHCTTDYILCRETNPSTTLDVSGLPSSDIAALQTLIDSLKSLSPTTSSALR